MSGFYLKLIGIITMFIDHWGYLISYKEWMRDIGRLSFIIFSFLTVEGFRHTKDKKRYITTLLIYAVVLQIPLIVIGMNYMNIFFTLFLGVVVLLISDLLPKYYYIPIGILAGVLSVYMRFDYPFYGVLIPLIFYKFSFKEVMFYILMVGIHLFSIYMKWVMPNQYLALISLVFIGLYNGKEGKKMKLFFYLFYPLHLGLIFLFKIYFS